MKVEIPGKICPHCGGTTWYGFKRGAKHKVYYECYQKKLEDARLYATKHKERYKKLRRKNICNNPEKYKEKRHLYRTKFLEKNPDYYKKLAPYFEKYYEKRRTELSDGYIKQIWSTLKLGTPTSEQIKKYRVHLKTLRLWRKIQKE